ncbi:MAG: DUF1294 domain-containing protein [Lachnospiraceae bacterium]|nr:DUF1294 domain-containing protein [Lachnospiraceae bacterium]
MNVYGYIAIYLGVLNLAGFAFMGIDKLKAKRHAFRIPEATLFVIAIFGGALGSTIGMYVFRHKTKHWYFLYGMPILATIWIVLVTFLLGSGIIRVI